MPWLPKFSDQGGGIPQDLHDKIFELYFTTKKDGSGIGLAQTYQVLQWHYGSVDFESSRGNGNRFSVSIFHSREPRLEDQLRNTPKTQRASHRGA